MPAQIKLEDFAKNVVLSNVKVNTSRDFGIYLKNTVDIQLNRYLKKAVYIDLTSFISTPLDLPFEPDDYYFHSENTDIVIFKVNKNTKTFFYYYDVINFLIVKKIELPFEVKEVGFNFEEIYFCAIIQKYTSNTSHKCSRRIPFYSEGVGTVGKQVKGLFKSDCTGQKISLISTLDMDVKTVDFDFLNQQIVFSATEVKSKREVSSDIYSYCFETDELQIHTLKDQKYRISSIKSISQKFLTFLGVDLSISSRNDNQQLYQVDLKDNKIVPLGAAIDLSNEKPSITTDSIFFKNDNVKVYNSKIYRVCVDRYNEVIYTTNLKGQTEKKDIGLTTIDSYQVLEDGLLVIGLKNLSLQEVYVYRNGELKRVTNYNKWLEKYKISRPKALKLFDEKTSNILDGWVFSPLKSNEDTRYPAILMIHGGPKMMYAETFSFDIQLLTSNGYVVFCVNPSGSDGRGNEFANIRGEFANKPYRQLMQFTDLVLEKYPMIDASRMGVTGGSYGGFMTNYIITQTDRFNAAVSERGISNLVTAFTSSDIGYDFIYEYMGNHNTPWTDMVEYMENSPITYANRVSTPTLFIHGKNDYRCHYTESLNMYSALVYCGVESKFCLFEDENHKLVVKGKPLNKKKRYHELVEWFDRYLKRR